MKIVLTLLLCAAALAAAAQSTNAPTNLATNAPAPLTLPEARALALKQHPRITTAELQAMAAREVVTQVRSAYFPQVSLHATAVGTSQDNTRIAAGYLNNPAIYEREADGLLVSQLITDFGRTSHLTRSSRLQSQAANQNTEATREQILLAVDTAFYTGLRAQALLAVALQTLATRQLLLDQISLLASNKIKSELDVSFARVAREEGRLLVARADNDVRAAQATLSTVLGYRDERIYQLVTSTLATNLPPEASALVATALDLRPDLRQLRYQRDAATQYSQAEKALRYPSLNAYGAAGVIPVRDPAFESYYAAAGIDLSFPLYTGGLLTARQREAEAKARAAGEQLRDAEDEVIRQVRVTSLNTQLAFEQIGLTQQLLESATEAFDLSNAKYTTGLSSIVELSQAELYQTQAQIDATSAKYDYQIQRSMLNYQIGAQR